MNDNDEILEDYDCLEDVLDELLDGNDDRKTNYAKYRGKCKEMSEAAVRSDPSLTLVRGHYLCWAWGEQPHWWTVRKDGTIYDPTAKQFPSEGRGEYIPFDGKINCAECGESVLEKDAYIHGNYAFCSGLCNGRFVGVY